MDSPSYVLKLMFEWGGGSLWCVDDSAFLAFGVGCIEDRLPLTSATRRRLDELRAWHDTSLNWEYPPDPGPWPPEEYERFEQAAIAALECVRAELRGEFEVVYKPL